MSFKYSRLFTKEGWAFESQNDWWNPFKKYNWYTLRLCHIEIENDAIFGAYECTIVLLGLGGRIRYTHTETEYAKDLEKRVEEMEKKIEAGDFDLEKHHEGDN